MGSQVTGGLEFPEPCCRESTPPSEGPLILGKTLLRIYIDKFTKYYHHSDLHCDTLLIKHGTTTEAKTTGMVGRVMIWSYDSNTPFSKQQSCAYFCTTRDLLGLQGACWVYKGLGSTSDHPISSKHYKSWYFGHKSLVRFFVCFPLDRQLFRHLDWFRTFVGP